MAAAGTGRGVWGDGRRGGRRRGGAARRDSPQRAGGSLGASAERLRAGLA